MKQSDKYSIKNLKKDFPNEEACLTHLFRSLHSIECSCGGKFRLLEKRKQFQCSKCRYQIAPMKGTIFQKSSTPLTSWFHAIWIFSNAKSGISAKEMERQLGVTYKTAWRILSLIRKSLKQNSRPLKGEVEMDEGYFGGRKSGGKNNEKLGEAMKAKAVVVGAVERGGNIKAEMTPNATSATITKFVEENIERFGTKLYTDRSNRYNNVAQRYERLSVDHGRGIYVQGQIHVNHVESFWSHVKRSIKGSFKGVSKQHLQSYLDAFVFHYNNRGTDKDRFDALIGRVVRLVE